MSHCFHQLYYHFVWATHRREELINRAWRTDLQRIIHEEAITRGGKPIRHNAMPDHVHLLVRISPTVLVSEFIGQVKGASAFRANREIKPATKLTWQEGYGVLSIRKDEVPRVSRYIDLQEQHHANGKLSELLERLSVDRDDWERESELPECVNAADEAP